MSPKIPPTLGEVAWRVARDCNGGSCVQVAAPSQDKILIGDSKRSDGLAMSYSRDEWVAFVQGIKEGDFDDLI